MSAPAPHRSAHASRLKTGGAMLAIAALVPALTLIPLGSLWLWQNGLLAWWVAGATLVSGLAYLGQRHLLARLTSPARGPATATPPLDATTAPPPSQPPDPSWSPREVAAWTAVEVLARTAEPAAATDRDAMLALGLRTIETVAESLHPGMPDPLFQFTVPEALTLIERVAQRLRPVFVETIPLGDQLTVAGALRIWRWRGALDWASRAWEVWRVVRLANPVTALGNEARERLTRLVSEGVRDEIARRLVVAYVREVGRAAIDLYGGRLKVAPETIATHVGAATTADRAEAAAPAEPVRILIAGQVSTGKSSLVNALAAEVRAAVDALPATRQVRGYEIAMAGERAAMLVDSPGVGSSDEAREAVLAAADQADLIAWVAAANRADRAPDRALLDAVRARLAARTTRRPPPLLIVMTHIDRLRPLADWAPPYDVAAPSRPKEVSIRAAMDAVAADLAVPVSDIVPVSLAPDRGANVELVWARIAGALPEAEAARLNRILQEAAPGFSWGRLVGQALAAGRLAAREASRAIGERMAGPPPPGRQS